MRDGWVLGHQPVTQQRASGFLCPRARWTSPEASSHPLRRAMRPASSAKMVPNVCLHPRFPLLKEELHGDSSDRSPVQDSELTRISACGGEAISPPPSSAWMVVPQAEKPSTEVVPGYPRHAWVLPWQPADSQPAALGM